MIRSIVEIDEGKCTGCGLCVGACHEGAIRLMDGKARLLRDDYCDGLGDCLPACPADAIRIVEREAAAYDEAAVVARQMAQAKAQVHAGMPAGGCPGSQAKAITRLDDGAASSEAPAGAAPANAAQPARLAQWPCQIKLVPTNAPYFDGAHLLVAADCCAFAYGSFHEDFMKGRVTLVGCPKLDGVDYGDKLAEICARNSIRSVTVCRMEVPCCGGIELAARRAVEESGRAAPFSVVTIATDGSLR